MWSWGPLWAQILGPFQSQIWILPRHSSGLLLGFVLGLFLDMCLNLFKAQIWGPSPHGWRFPLGQGWRPIPSCMLAPSWPWAVLHGPAALLGLTVLLPLPTASSPPPAPLTPLQPLSSPAPHMSVRHFYVTPENLGAHLRHSSAVAPNLFPQILLPTPKVVFS